MIRCTSLLLLGFVSSVFAQSAQPIFDNLYKLRDVSITSPTNTQVLTYDIATGKWKNAAGGGGGGGAVTSVFGRTGDILALANDYSFAQIGSKPTTLAGYGITDAQPLDSDLSAIAALSTTSFGRGGLTQVDAAGFRSYIGAGTGNGTVTTFSAGNLSPLFTSSVATASTTPALTFTLSNAAANTWFGNSTASSAAPAYNVAGALTKTDDTNVTLTLGGSSSTALLNSASLTLGWTGTLSQARGGFGKSSAGVTDGQIPIGRSSDNSWQFATLTAGTNVTITNGGGSVTIAASGGGGGVTSITGTSPIIVSPTTGAAVASLDVTVDHAFTAAQSITLTNATTNVADTILTLDHESSATPTTSFGESIDFKLKDNSTANVLASRIAGAWSNAIHASRVSVLDFYTAQNGNPSLRMELTGQGGLTVGGTAYTAALGIINADTGYINGGTVPGNGRLLQSDGTKYANGITIPTSTGSGFILVGNTSTAYINSTPTFPALSTPAIRKIIVSDGTNWVASTETWPTAAGVAGYHIYSNGTNFVTWPTDIENSSISDQTGFAADQYLTDSTITVAAGDWKQRGQYTCTFQMEKTAAGTATPIITLRMGTAGTTSDAAIATMTFTAGTATIDVGVFIVNATFRTVGSGTSALVQAVASLNNGQNGGLVSNANGTKVVAATSAGFNSTTPTKIGLSFNGGTSFSGTCRLVQAQLHQP